MSTFIIFILFTWFVILFLILLNDLSYGLLKELHIARDSWDLNICCGYTECGKINADIVKHSSVKNFVLLEDIYNLPFQPEQFGNILCSHTIEHIEDPQKFHNELSRVGKRITYLVPPLWDLTAAFNIFEHRWIFLTIKKRHNKLPKYVKLPFSKIFQKLFGQKIKA